MGKIHKYETASGYEFMASLPNGSSAQLVAAGRVDIESGEVASARLLDWIHSKRAGQDLEIKQINAGQSNGDTTIRIVGGLPAIPGTDIIMPGDPADPSLVNGPTLEYAPGESVPMEPLNGHRSTVHQTMTEAMAQYKQDLQRWKESRSTDRSTDRATAQEPAE
jgi:hypothetical protein